MVVYYFGADKPWDNQDESSINRRNMAYLLCLSRDKRVDKIYNIIRSKRKTVLNKKNQKVSKNTKIKNVYIAPLLPERGLLGHFSTINRSLIKLIYFKCFLKSSNSRVINWCYWPKGFLDYQYLKTPGELVFDSDHNLIKDPNRKIDNSKLIELLKLISQEADYIISGSRSMLNWFKSSSNANLILGLNGTMINQSSVEDQPSNDKTRSIVYCGTLSPWIKKDWLVKIIQQHTDITFHIIGKDYNCNLSEELKLFNNVNLHGYLSLDEAKKVISKADIAIALYDEAFGIDGSSMKIFDYLTLGKKIVTNKFHENLSSDFNNLIFVAEDYNQFEDYILNKIHSIPNKQNIDAFLEANTWTNIVNDILIRIEK